MVNTEKGYKRRNIYILSDSQVAIQVLINFYINSKLGYDCHQSPVKLTEYDRVQPIWVSDTWELVEMKWGGRW
jgi:hypothetical protein